MLTQLAYNVVQNARKACGAHDDLAREVSSLHLVLCRVEVEVSKPDSILNKSDDGRSEGLEELAKHCNRVLKVSAQILDKYNALSDEKKSMTKLWQRIRFGNGEMLDLAKIKDELATHTQALTIFLNLLSVGSQGKVEKYMDSHGEELRNIKHSLHWVTASLQAKSHDEKSILTTNGEDDKAIWKAFRRELIEEGFSCQVLETHRMTIKQYILELGERGALDDSIDSVEAVSKQVSVTSMPPEKDLTGATTLKSIYNNLEPRDVDRLHGLQNQRLGDIPVRASKPPRRRNSSLMNHKGGVFNTQVHNVLNAEGNYTSEAMPNFLTASETNSKKMRTGSPPFQPENIRERTIKEQSSLMVQPNLSEEKPWPLLQAFVEEVEDKDFVHGAHPNCKVSLETTKLLSSGDGLDPNPSTSPPKHSLHNQHRHSDDLTQDTVPASNDEPKDAPRDIIRDDTESNIDYYNFNNASSFDSVDPEDLVTRTSYYDQDRLDGVLNDISHSKNQTHEYGNIYEWQEAEDLTPTINSKSAPWTPIIYVEHDVGKRQQQYLEWTRAQREHMLAQRERLSAVEMPSNDIETDHHEMDYDVDTIALTGSPQKTRVQQWGQRRAQLLRPAKLH